MESIPSPLKILAIPERLRQIEKEKERWEIVEKIEGLESKYKAMSNDELEKQTHAFKSRIALATHGKSGESLEKAEQQILDEILPEAFATVREASKRTLGLRHHDVQLMAGILLNEGSIAEMKTGEGKTLVATLPLYLNALLGKGVHLVTVNDYLARRDARWMIPIFRALGMSVGVLQMGATTENATKAYLVDADATATDEPHRHLRLVDRVEAYKADITYGPNSEFGFDYLRDNMAMQLDARVQRGRVFAIVDEVDNVLIDEARTPLILSGPASSEIETYTHMAQVVKDLRPEDYEINERNRSIALTEVGTAHVEAILGQTLFDPEKPEKITNEQIKLTVNLEQALRAQYLFKKDKNYLVQGGKVIIVDEFTGRAMPGRRWGDGLHQAVEAKEGVKLEPENITYAAITLQNYFRMYEKLAGMSGTALTEAEEFDKVYKLNVIPVIPNEEDRRKDLPDVVYKTKKAKLDAIVIDIVKRQVKGQPILVGTTSVENSEEMAKRLSPESINKVLTALLRRDSWFKSRHLQDDGRTIPKSELLSDPIPYQVDPTSPDHAYNIEALVRLLQIQTSEVPQLIRILEHGIPHQILSAKPEHVARESQIIAEAGKLGAVTIATNMAGRGVDIRLGGEIPEEIRRDITHLFKLYGIENPYDYEAGEKFILEKIANSNLDTGRIEQIRKQIEDTKKVKKLGGLHVIGSERHEARRLDNQLRGRAARQGDPGSSRYYLSLQDYLMRMFGGEQVSRMMTRFDMDDSVPIEAGLVSSIIEGSQARVEGANFDVRKHLLEYDDVLNKHRTAIYSQRDKTFDNDNLTEDVLDAVADEAQKHVEQSLAMNINGPLELIMWAENVQPPFATQDGIFPSYGFKLILDQFDISNLSALQIVSKSIKADETFKLKQIESYVNKVAETYRSQKYKIDDIIDDYFEKLDNSVETPTAEKVLRELSSELHFNLTLDDKTLRALNIYPKSTKHAIRSLAADQAYDIYIQGMTKFVENYIGKKLQLPESLPKSPNEVEELIIQASRKGIEQKNGSLFTKIKGESRKYLKKNRIKNASDKFRFLLSLASQVETVTDPRTKQTRKVLVGRFSYSHYAAQLFENAQLDDPAEDVVTHLEKAEVELQKAWGETQLIEHEKIAKKENHTLNQQLKIFFDQQKLTEKVGDPSELDHKELVEIIGANVLNKTYGQILLNLYSELWVEHLSKLEALRTSVGLEAYAQHDPLVQYKLQASAMFNELLGTVRANVVARAFKRQHQE